MDAEKLKTIAVTIPKAILQETSRTLTIVFISFNFFNSFNFPKVEH